MWRKYLKNNLSLLMDQDNKNEDVKKKENG